MLARIPSLVQMIVMDILVTLCLGAGALARFTDAWGWNDGRHLFAPVDGVVWGASAIGLFLLYLLVRQMWNPRVQEVSWSPVRHFGSISVVVPGDSWSVRTTFLTSHPAYVLLDLVAGVIPMVIVDLSWEDDITYNPTMRLWHWALGVWALIPTVRLACWFLFRRRPDFGPQVSTRSAAKAMEWELAWKPTMAFWGIAFAALIPATTVAFLVDREKDPVLDAAMYQSIIADTAAYEEERFHITGKMVGALKEWPVDGELHPGAGLLLEVPGGEALVVCNVHDLKRMKRSLEKSARQGGDLSFTVRVMQPKERPGKPFKPASIDAFVKLYNWRFTDFAAAPGGKPRLLLRWVDP